jgi:uncharacterized protein YjiS (DUF1127 family)
MVGFSSTHFVSLAPARRFPAISGVFGRIWRVVAQAARLAATRRELAELDDRMLQDLGISRAQAAFEASRAPWDSAFRRTR